MTGTFTNAPDAPWRRCPPASAETALAEIRASLSDSEKKKIKTSFAEYTRIGKELQKYNQASINQSHDREKAALNDGRLSPDQTAAAVLEERRFRESAPIFEQKVRIRLADARRKLFPACIKILEALVAMIDKELAAAPTLGETQTRWGLAASEELVRAIAYPLLRLRSMAEWDLDAVYRPGRADDANYVDGSFPPEKLLGNLA